MSVLLREADGFESLLVGEVVHRPDDLPTANCDDHADGRLGRDPAGEAAPPDSAKEHNAAISRIAKLLSLDLEVLNSVRQKCQSRRIPS